MPVDPGLVQAQREPLGPRYHVEPLFEGGYRVTDKRTGYFIETHRSMTLADAVWHLMQTQERLNQ